MPELTDAQKVNREVTQKRIATALETLAQNSEAPIGLGMTGATVGQVPVVKTVDANGVPTSYEPGAGGGGLPAGGTDGDVLVKDGATDYDATWKKPQYCRPNLLDNWYFVGGGSQQGDGYFPINQRGQSYYPNEGYCIDRWTSSGAFYISQNYINMGDNTSITQKLEAALKSSLNGKNITLSLVCLGNAKLISGTVVYQSAPESAITVASDGTFALSITHTGDIELKSANTYANCQAIKLELGTKQTLAHQENNTWVLNEIPDYGQELEKCMRYYLPTCGRLCNAYYYGDSTGYLDILIPTPVKMASPLAVELENSEYVVRASDNTAMLINSSKPISVLAIEANAVTVRVTNLTFGNPFVGLTANTTINLKSTI